MRNVTFEPTISLGTIIQAVVFVVTVAVAYARFVARMTRLETKLNILWGVFARKVGFDIEGGDTDRFFHP